MHRYNETDTLLIFDLDGTLLDVFDYHKACVEKIVKEVWNVPDLLPKSKRFGYPQKETIRKICEAGGVPGEEIVRHLPRAQSLVTEQMRHMLPEDITNLSQNTCFICHAKSQVVASLNSFGRIQNQRLC